MSTNCIDCVANKRTGTDLLCDICRALKREKNARIYYQDIVYAVCNVLDKVNGELVVCGTLEAPTTQVAEAMTKMLARLRAAEAIVAKLPKTADGVPVTLGMNLYASYKDLGMIEADGIARGGFLSMTNEGHAGEDEFSGIFITEHGEEFECIEPSQCYSTEAAAKAALAASPPSPPEGTR